MREAVALFTRFVHRTGGGQGLLLSQWIPVRADDDVRELVMFPELSGYQLLFYSTWANETIVLEDFDILKSYPEEQVWPWCAYCQKFLHPVGAHRKSKAHRKCIKFCGLNGVEDKRRRVMQ